MKERPILFSAPMVRAILEGRKTQTRRVMNPQPVGSDWRFDGRRWQKWYGYPVGHDVFLCPYGEPGDRLWVRETWNALCSSEAMWWHEMKLPLHEKKAMNWAITNPIRQAFGLIPPRWVSARFMPRFAARVFLEIANVRVEQVQNISPADICAEGIDCLYEPGRENLADHYNRQSFAKLWDSLNVKRNLGWNTNPWVWVIEFKAVTP